MNDDRVAHKQLVTTIREQVPHVLHLRARLPGQGDRDPRRTGERHPDALHRLRQLRHRLQPERQGGAGAASPRPRRSSPRRRRSRRSSPRATLPSSPSATRRRWSPALRDLGFDSVHEVAFGADLVARDYARLLADDREGRHVATTCPAVVSYVRKYHPDLLDSLAPIVSPMIATARALERRLGAGDEDRLRRPVHRQEGRGRLRAVRRRDRRRAHVRRAARDVRAQGHRPGRTCRRRTTTSTRRTAASAASSPSPAACCRRPG